MDDQAGARMNLLSLGNLLSLDGGGIRGLSSLYILQDLMEKIRHMQSLSTEPLPCDHFDMICGTSTGGIIALMLGRLRMPISDCIAAYVDMCGKVFGHPQNILKGEKFDPRPLEEAIQTVVANKLDDPNALLLEDKACKTFVCTCDRKVIDGPPVLLRTYESGSVAHPCTIWQAARATSAAPTIFPPMRFDSGEEYVDGGLGYNNPSSVLIKEAKSYYDLKSDKATRPCLVSIGTGEMNPAHLDKASYLSTFKDRTGISLAPVLVQIATNCEKTHREVLQFYHENDAKDRYYRFNVHQGLQEIGLDEWKKIGEIRAHTDRYLRSRDQELIDCAKALCIGKSSAPREDKKEESSPPNFQITQHGSSYQGSNTVSGGQLNQGNFIGGDPFARPK